MFKYTILFTGIVIIFQVFMVNMYAASGGDIYTLQQDIKHLKTQNQVLSDQLYEKSSLNHLAQRAKNLNLSPQKISFESSPLPVASRNN